MFSQSGKFLKQECFKQLDFVSGYGYEKAHERTGRIWFSALYWGVQVNNMEDLDLHGGADSLTVNPSPPTLIFPVNPTLPARHLWWNVPIQLVFFTPISSSTFFSSRERLLTWEDAVSSLCCPVLTLSVWNASPDLLSTFYPQIPIISADHLSSHKYLTQM